jgi:hypothetical protein
MGRISALFGPAAHKNDQAMTVLSVEAQEATGTGRSAWIRSASCAASRSTAAQSVNS